MVAPAPPIPSHWYWSRRPMHRRSCSPQPCAGFGERERCNYALLERACGGVLYTLTPARIALGCVVLLQADPDCRMRPRYV